MQDNREKNACRGQKDEMHVSAVLDLFILDWLSLLHVTALGEQKIISTKGQLSERVVMIVYSLMHQNDTTGQSIRRVCFQMMCPRLGQRLGRNQSDNPVTKGMTGLNSIGIIYRENTCIYTHPGLWQQPWKNEKTGSRRRIDLLVMTS